MRGWVDVVRRLRQVAYDVALDFQGLMKSAVLARASGAARVAGFSIWHLREKGARPFYSETERRLTAMTRAHVIQKNLRLLRVVGIETAEVEFPLRTCSVATRATRSWPSIGARTICADQSWRGVAEQALAAVAVRRSGGVPARRARPAVGRAVGAGRGRARAVRRGRVGRRRPRWRRQRRLPISWRLPRGSAGGVRRHRSAAHRGGRRHTGGRHLRSDRSRRGTVRGRQAMSPCRDSSRAAVTTSASAARRRGVSTSVSVAEVTAAIQQRLGRAAPGDADTMSDLARGLARYRVRLGFVVGAGRAVAGAADAAQPDARRGVAAAGEALRIWAAGHLEKGREVTASGPYR